MSGEIATAYVSLIPSASDLGKGIDKDLSVAGDRAGKTAGDKASKGIVGTLGKTLKWGMIGIGAAAGAQLGAALYKGWGRLTKIENATAKLTGLGNSAKDVKSIMDNALASVKGTAFGLDEAATVAASAVAAGVKPGKDLQRTLGLTADAATIAGVSMGDMGQIFGKVATSNKIQGEVINQLNAQGIPIIQLLGKSLGKTSTEVTKMASQGKIDFAMFQTAMEQGLGGAALKSGETTQGAFKNMGAALSRFGASLLKDVFPLAKVVFGGITSLVDSMTAKVGPAIGRVMTSVKDGVSYLSADGLKGIVDGMRAFAKGADISDAFDGVNGTLANILASLITFYQKAKGIFSGLGDAIKSAFKGDFSGIADIGATLVSAIAAYLPKLLTSGTSLVLKLIDGILAALPEVLAAATTVISKLVDGIAKTVPALAKAAAPIIVTLVTAIATALPQLISAGVSAVTSLIDGIMSALPSIVSTATSLVTQVATAIVKALPQIATAAVSLVTSLISGIVGALPSIITAASTLVSTLLTAIVDLLPTIVTAGLSLLTSIVTGIVDNLPLIVGAVTTFVSSLVSQVSTLLPTIIAAGLDMLTSIISGIVDNLPKIVTAATTLVTSLLTQLVAMLPKIVTGGLGLLNGVITGIVNNLPKIIDAAVNLVSTLLTALINNLPKIVDAGLALLVGLIGGILNNLPKIVTAAVTLITKLVSTLAENLPMIVTAAIEILTSLVGAITDPNNLLALVKAAPQIIWALIKGIGQMGSALWDAIVGLVTGKTLSVAVKFIGDFWRDFKNMAAGKSGILTGSSLDPLKGLPGHAAGGTVGDGWFTVGERGPELGYKSGALTRIFSNSDSRQMASARPAWVDDLIDAIYAGADATVSGIGGSIEQSQRRATALGRRGVFA